MAIFNSWHSSFLIVLCSPFQKSETQKSWHKWLLSNWSRSLNWKRPGTYPQSFKLLKRFLKSIALAYIYQLAKYSNWMSCGSKDIFQMHLILCANTHHDFTNLVNHEMLKKTKNWTSWERNIAFPQIKRIINLCLK